MAAPPKPWERLRDVNHRQPNYHPDLTPSFIPASPHLVPEPGGGGRMATTSHPPLPPRPAPVTPYSTFHRPSFGGYGSMGMYGGSYRGFGHYGMNGLPDITDENGFIQLAENSSRQAFESIESIVHAFGSVSMMLESTYHAVYSSFRAVLGVADHFNRMKSHFAQIFSALAVVRTLRWLYRKLLYLIGLRSQDPSLEAVWRNANPGVVDASQITEADIKASKSSWPIVLFLAVVFGGPYLIWRLLSSLVPTKTKSQGWVTGQEQHYAAFGQYPFQARMRNELSFVAGQPLILAPKDQQPSVQGWLLASNGKNMGLVPANHIKILGLRAPRPQQGSNQQKQENQVAASRIPSIPSPQLGPRPSFPLQSDSVRNFSSQQGTPYIQQRLSSSQQGAPLTTWQGAPVTVQQEQGVPLTTQQGVPLGTQLGPPLTTQQGTPLGTKQGAPLGTQQGAPLITQQGAPLSTQHGTPLNALQGQGAALTTQQGTPQTTQQGQGAPLSTQLVQGTPVTTQQGAPPVTHQLMPKSSLSKPTLTQQEAPQKSQGLPRPLQDVSPMTPEGEAVNLTQRTNQFREEKWFYADELNDTDDEEDDLVE